MIKKISILALFLIYILLLFDLNAKMPLLGEDFALSLPYSDRVLSIFEKVPLLYNKIYFHSIGWNARLGEQLAIVFSSIDKRVFDLLNVLITFFFLYLLITYALGKFPKRNITTLLLFIVGLSILFLLPMAGDNLLWISVVTNYLWSIFLLAVFFLPYRLLFSGRDIFQNKHFLIQGLFFPVALLAGMTNENTIIAVIVIIILGYLFVKTSMIQSITIPKWYWSHFVFLCIGYGYLLLSPSTKLRREYYANAYGIQNPGISYYLKNIFQIIKNYIHASELLLILLGIIIAIYFILALWKHITIPNERRINLLINFFLFAASFVSVVALIVVPYFESRSLLFNWFCLIALMLGILIELINYKEIFLLLTVPILVLGLVKSTNLYHCIIDLSTDSYIRQNNILTQINNGSRDITITRFTDTCNNILSNRDDWLVQFSHDENYYQVDHIYIINP